MKKTLWILVIAIVLFFVFSNYVFDNKEVEQLGEGTTDGEVTAVNLDGVAADGPALVTLEDSSGRESVVAIPSMGLPLCEARENIGDAFSVEVGDNVSVKGDLNEEGQIVPCESSDHYFRIIEVHQDSEVNLEFEYRKSPDGYVLESHSQDGLADPSFVKLFSLMLKDDYESFKAMTDASEGPPSINISIFRNTENQSASVWVDANPSISNMGLLVGEVDRDAVVGGANAVRYMIDGLYMNDTVAVAHGDFIYLISGAFIEQDSMIRDDFEPFLNSIRFLP